MTEQSDSSTALMTSEVGQQTPTGSSMTSSSSRGTAFYFQCAVVAIGIIGTTANAVIIYALIVSEQYKKHLLIINQNALDLLGCVFLVVSYTAKCVDIRLTGSSGHWLCATILSEAFVWWGVLGSKWVGRNMNGGTFKTPTLYRALLGSKIALAAITIDRYLKIVHPTKKVGRRVIYATMAFCWCASLVYTLAVNFTTSRVIDGVCYGSAIWESQAVKMAHGIWNFISFYFVILVITLFCYSRILVVIRRHTSLLASYEGAGSSAAHSYQMQTNVIKTMITVSAFYAVTNFPVDFYFLLTNVMPNVTLLDGGYYASLFIVFL